MSKLVRELHEIAEELVEKNKSLTPFEALQIATKVQYNRLFEEAFMLGNKSPGALEAIAMELGSKTDGDSIKDAIYSLRQ